MLALVGGALLSQPQPVQTPPPADAGNPNMADPNMVNPMMGNPMMNGGGDFMKNMQQQMEQAQKMGIMPDANNMNKVRARGSGGSHPRRRRCCCLFSRPLLPSFRSADDAAVDEPAAAGRRRLDGRHDGHDGRRHARPGAARGGRSWQGPGT